jgi:hypothetical protein
MTDITRRLRLQAIRQALHQFWGPIPQAERDSTLNGAFQLMGQTLLGTFLPLLLLDGLHGTAQDMALMSSLPSLVGLGAVLLGAWWLARTRNLLGLTLGAVIAARAVLPLMAGAPFLGPGPAVVALLLLNALMNFPGALANMGWQAYIGDLIAPERRAAFFAERNRVINLAGMLVAIVAGLGLQAFRPTLLWPYQLALLAAGGFAVLEVWFLSRHPRLAPPAPAEAITHSSWWQLLGPGRFRRVFWSAMTYNLVWQMAWPLFPLYQIDHAHATAFWVALFGVLGQLGAILSLKAWGRASERVGIAWPLFFAAVGVALGPALTVMSLNLDWLAGVNLIMGVFGAGFQMLLFNQLLEAAPRPQRTAMVALYNVGLGVVGVSAPELGVWLLAQVHMTASMELISAFRAVAAVGFLWAGGVAWMRRRPHPLSRSI